MPREVALLRRRKQMPPPVPRRERIERINQLRPLPSTELDPARDAEIITGRLGFANELERHNEIGLAPDGGGPPIRIEIPRGLMSDIVKPLWGSRVSVLVVRRGGVYEYIDHDEAD
jgi:hypothetical protein